MTNIQPTKPGALDTSTATHLAVQRPISENKLKATVSAIGGFFKIARSDIRDTISAVCKVAKNPYKAALFLGLIVACTLIGTAIGAAAGGGFGGVVGASVGFAIGLAWAIHIARKDYIEAADLNRVRENNSVESLN